MKLPRIQRRTFTLITIIISLLAILIYIAIRSGPLAPIPVTVVTVESQAIAPALFGIGTVQARFAYKIGPTFAGRVKYLDVHVGDTVEAGQILGEMDAVDLNHRILAQQAAIKSSEATLQQAEAKQSFAQTQANRYEQLLAVHGIKEEAVAIKQQELAVSNAALTATRENVVRLKAELEALRTQRDDLKLIAPVTGLVTSRNAEPGTTMIAGQAVVEIIEPTSLWIDTRFDQISADGLTAGLPAQIILRSRQLQEQSGRVLRIEPRADAVTEETLAKVVFNTAPIPLPPLGELAEVTVQLSKLPATPTIPNAAIRIVNGQRGVWRLVGQHLSFTPIVLGRSDLNGLVQVIQGLAVGDRVVVYSEKTLTTKSRVHVRDHLVETSP